MRIQMHGRRRLAGGAMRTGAAVFGCLLVTTIASAQGLTRSVPLTDVLARAKTSPQVDLMVRLQLKRAKLKRDDVICQAQVVDRSWPKLSGGVVGPYECPIGPRTLVLMGKPIYADAASAKVRRSDPTLKERATVVRETHFRWRWRKA